MAAGYQSWFVDDAVDTPALLIDRARLEANIAGMADALRERDVALRPHTKTHKSVEIARRQLANGATGITVATLGEAEVFAAAGISDIFLAYPLWASPPKADRLRAVLDRARLRIGVDSVEGVRQLGVALPDRDLEIMIEADSGGRRTGVVDVPAAVAVAAAVSRRRMTAVGVFTHGGHSYARREATDPAADDEVRVLTATAEALRAAGHPVTVLSAGSTPTALLSARAAVTEERPGTYVFGDRQQAALGAVGPDQVAMVVAATVVSAPEPGRVVLDAGAKTLSKDNPDTVDGFGALTGYPHARITHLYDHHAVVRVDGRGASSPQVGELVTVVPNHACPVANLADRYLVVDGGKVVDEWPVDARARSG